MFIKKRTCIATAVAALGALSAAHAAPSSKFAAEIADIELIKPTEAMSWRTVLKTTIKTPNHKDLLIGGSLETALYTATMVSSKTGTTDTSKATAVLEVRILVDGQAAKAWPKEVVYDQRVQQLSATLGGVIQSCRDANLDGVLDIADECIVTPEQIELIQNTMGARHFNFIAPNVSTGTHTVELQVKVSSSTSVQTGTASAHAAVGRGVLTVEEVRATNAPDGITFVQ